MSDQFQVPKEHGVSILLRLGVILFISWLLALAVAALDLHSGGHLVWESVFIKTVWLFAIGVIGKVSGGWDRLVSVRVEEAEFVVHRRNEQIPLIGRWFSPRRFPKSEWRLASTKQGLFVGKPSSDPSFQWEEELIFPCPKAARPALKAWIAQLG